VYTTNGKPEGIMLRPFHLCSDDGICPCTCNYAVHVGCTCRDLKGPVAINVNKSAVSVIYPGSYLRWVDQQPREETINTSSCNVEWSDNATCGVFRLPGAGMHPNSQVQSFFYSYKKHKCASIVLQCLGSAATTAA
jgi:hypothetical protein